MRRISVLLVLAACGGGTKTGGGGGDGSGTGDDPATCTASTEDEFREIYGKLKRVEPPTGDEFCISISATFQGWVNFGWFASDAGCIFDTYVYQCELTTPEAPARAMAAAGWADADPARRTELLVAYLSEIIDTHVVTADPNGEFGKYGHTFTPPSYDGTWFTYWTNDGGGMSPEVTYAQLKWNVNADGTLGLPEEQAKFTTVYQP